MKILILAFSRLRNAEHFQFMTEFKDLVNRFGASVLKITKLFNIFLVLYDLEDECQIVIQKSSITKKLSDADNLRDATFRGLSDAVNSALNHFNAEKAEAARRLKIVLKAYGNLAQKPVDQETSDIYNLIQELEGKYTADIELLGFGEWVTELKNNNESYEALVKERDAESAEKPDIKTNRVRAEIEEAYRNTTRAIESFALLTEDEQETENYTTFIRELNAVITRYDNRLAQREGRAEAKKKESE